VQPSTFWGEVHIGRESNPELHDMANRQGLMENEASDEFVAHVQGEFREFEELVTPELEARWKPKAEKARDRAEERVAFAAARARGMLHALRQPLAGLANELGIMGSLVHRAESDQLIRQLEEVHDKASGHLERVEKVLSRYGDLSAPARTEQVRIGDLIGKCVDDVEAQAVDKGVRLESNVSSDRDVYVPADLVIEALAELLRNGLDAPRGEGAEGVVAITAKDAKGCVQIAVSDDGAGMDGVAVGTPLGQITLATKARPSGGLATVDEFILLAGGSAKLTRNGPSGVTVTVELPTTIREM
jgi:signal transduction histidine kinase